MKKILMRSVMSPFEEASVHEILTQNRIGSNLGNMIFPYSTMRNLMSEETQIDTTATNKDFMLEDMDYINSEYDCVVMPFANAFRPNYEEELQNLTRLVKRIKIPFIVVGIGCNHSFKQGLDCQFPFDKTVQKFLKAVLDKSAVVGIRGEATATYLKRLGFREETDYRVIGCPSMFMWGPYLPDIEKKELRPDSPVSFNWKINIQKEVHDYMRGSLKKLTNYHYVPQILDEIMLMYYGKPLPGTEKYPKLPKGYPTKVNHPFYMENRASAFVNVPTWMEYLKTKELSFGSRIHGNIIPLLSGTPSYIVAPDYRVLELARYHDIPHTMCTELKSGQTIFDLYEKADYGPMLKNHKERYQRFSEFLKENGLTPVLDDKKKMEKTCFDEKVEHVKLQPELRPFFTVSADEQAKRLEEIQMHLIHQYEEMRDEHYKVWKLNKVAADVVFKAKYTVVDLLKK